MFNDMERLIIVYSIKNIQNNFLYVGATFNLYKRKWKHIYDLKNNNHHSKLLQKDWNDLTPDMFIFEVIEKFILKSSDKFVCEQKWIDTLKPEYNIYLIAGSAKGFKHSAETKNKMSKSAIGKKLSENHKDKIREAKKNLSLEARRNLSNALKGNKNSFGCICSDETKRKISIANSNPSDEKRLKLRNIHLGKKRSKEHLDNMSKAMKGRPWSENRRQAQINKSK